MKLRFMESGGYDCMSDAWWIEDEKGEIIAEIDIAWRDAESAEIYARTIAQRLA